MIRRGDRLARDLQNVYAGGEVSSGIARDLMGARNGSAVVGDAHVEPVGGEIGSTNAYVFDGTSDAYELGTGTSFNMQEFTISTWVRRAGTLANFNGIFVAPHVGSGAANFLLTGIGTNKVRAYVNDGSWQFVTSDVTLDLGRWYNVVQVADGSNVHLWVNGAEQSTPASYSTLNIGTTSPARIGNYAGGASDTWNGDIAEVRFYSRALADSEVQALYAPATRWSIYAPRRIYIPVGAAVVPEPGEAGITSTNLAGSAGRVAGFGGGLAA